MSSRDDASQARAVVALYGDMMFVALTPCCSVASRDDASQARAAVALYGDMMFVAPAVHTLRLHANHSEGQGQGRGPRTFHYLFSYAPR